MNLLCEPQVLGLVRSTLASRQESPLKLALLHPLSLGQLFGSWKQCGGIAVT